MNKNAFSYSLLLITLFLGGYCYGQGTVGTVYHNTCARYNGYYNAKNKMNKGAKNAAGSLQDDYTKLLPVDKNDLMTGGSLSDADSIIIRLTLVNKLHPKSKWLDDCNMLIGRAYYMKKDYESAGALFQYIVASHKQKKGEKGEYNMEDRPEYDGVKVPWPKPVKKWLDLSFFKHKPLHDEALLWLLNTYEKLNKKDEVENILNLVEKNNDAIDFKYRGRLEAHKAQFMIDQKRYADAIRPMVYAVALTDDKKMKTRYVYILAQLYQLAGKSDKSIKAFKDVLTMEPDYKMQFYANINLARSYSASASTPAAEIIEMLNKLANNDKYAEFKDQVYYAIAEIELKEGQKDKAVAELNKSIAASVNDNNQKGLSFLKLGELSFDAEQYLPAKNYYDSTLAFLKHDYKDFADVKKRSSILSSLVMQLTIIHQQDSLLKLASMSPKDRDVAIAEELARIEKAKADALALKNSLAAAAANNKSGDASGWYFYNATVRSSGYSDFGKKWGTRKLEDNWRRTNKGSLDVDDADNNSTDTVKKEGAVTKETLLAGIPLTEDKKKETYKKIAAAYYKMGVIYKEDLENVKKALETFDTLELKYPNNEFESLALYQLYILYTRTNELAKAEECKQKILKNYPTSPVAQYINNPNYEADKKKANSPVENYYLRVYKLYNDKRLLDVLRAIDSSRILYPANDYSAKFDLLRAFTIAQTQSKDSFKIALTNLTKKYATGPEQQRAKDELAFMAKNANIGNKKPGDVIATKDFAYNPSSTQMLVVFFDEVKPSEKGVQDSIARYNSKNHGSESLKIGTMLMDKGQIITVKTFKNSTIGMNYYKEIQANDKLFSDVETSYHVFLIDDKNFQIFYKNKNIEEYMAFFDKSYH